MRKSGVKEANNAVSGTELTGNYVIVGDEDILY